MFVKIRTHLNSISTNRVLLTVMLVILVLAIMVGFVWMQADHVIAPPGLGLMNWLWKVFVCRCPV